MGEEVREAVSSWRRQHAVEAERLEGKVNSWGSRAERDKGGFCWWAGLLLPSHTGAIKGQASGPCHVVYVLEKGRRELATSEWYERSPETFWDPLVLLFPADPDRCRGSDQVLADTRWWPWLST